MRSERGDFNSCGKWSSGVLPIMLWWSLAWFPYFYLDCPWPYCVLLNSFVLLPTFRFRRQPNFCWTLCESTNWRRICLGDLAFPRRSKKASGWLVFNRRPKVLPLLAKFSPTSQKILEEEVIKEEASLANADQIALHQVFLKFHLRFIQTMSRQQAMSLLLLMARK